MPVAKVSDARDQVAQHVGHHRSGQRRDPGDRQHLEPVEDALVHVLAELDAGGDAGGEHGLAHQAGDDAPAGSPRRCPEIAPPKMPANIAVNSSGWMVTSKSCSKLRRIFMVARQAMVMVCVTVARSPTWADRPAAGVAQGGGEGGHRTVSSSGVGLVVARVGRSRRCRGRSGPGTPRRGRASARSRSRWRCPGRAGRRRMSTAWSLRCSGTVTRRASGERTRPARR